MSQPALPIKLNARDVYTKALEAARNGKLQFQTASIDSFSGCFYKQNCAIGASLTPEVQEFFDSEPVVNPGEEDERQVADTSISELIHHGFVTADDSIALIELQGLHDQLVGVRCADRLAISERTKKFIDFCEAKLAAL